MNIKSELNNLTEEDIYSLMMFTLFKTNEIPEYSTLSELSYILDKESLLKLCEFYGGMTITIPTISELEKVLYALFMFQEVDIKAIPFDQVYEELRKKQLDANHIKDVYYKVKELLKNYNFNSGRKGWCSLENCISF